MNIHRLRNRTAFMIYSEQGGDYNKFINTLRNSPVQFYSLSFRHDKLYGYVRSRDYKRLTEFADKFHLTIEKITESGINTAAKKYKLRWGIPIGLILSFLMISFLSDRVMMIEIGGNQSIPNSRIISLLRDSGVYIGSSLSNVNLREVERKIKIMDKSVGWIGIKNTGSRVVVEISELTEPPEMERKNTPCNIVASRDAQLTNVRLYSGMLVQMVGDGVKKGDIIVSGTVDTKFGRTYYVHSIGEITGRYTEKMNFSEALVSNEKIVTGEVEKKALSIFGKRLIYSDCKIDGEYEYYETQIPLTLGKITFPVSKIVMHYKLIDTAQIERTQAEAEKIIEQRIKRYEENFLSDGIEIINRDVQKNTANGVVSLNVTYTLEGEIGMEKQIFAKYEGFDRYADETEEEKK